MKKNKRNLTILFLCFSIGTLSAKTQTVGDVVFNWIYQHMFFVLAGIVILGVLATMFNFLWGLILHQKQIVFEEAGIQDTAPVDSTPLWKKLYNKAWSLIPMEKESDIMLHHDFDGIHELDNKLPPWWVYLFFATIVWGAVYFYMFQYSDDAKTQTEIYEIEMQQAKEAKRLYASKQANSVDEYNVVSLEDEVSLAAGRKTFITNCAACHGVSGEGGIGPNLTDEYWIHGGSTSDIFKTIKYGVPEKGMVAWKAQLSPSSIQKVTSFIETLQGTNPPNGKEKQGEKYIGETTEVIGAIDSNESEGLAMSSKNQK